MSSDIYRLSYTGNEVDEAIGKINSINTDGTGSGGITELVSSELTPYNLNFLRTTGMYKASFVYDLTAPQGASRYDPVMIYVSKMKSTDDSATETLVQTVSFGADVHTRSSVDGGVTWGDWESQCQFDGATEITPEEVEAAFLQICGTDAAFASDVDGSSIISLLSNTTQPVTTSSANTIAPRMST